MTSSVKAVILAGGQSTRFSPFSEKSTWVFLGKPLLSWHFDELLHAGISDVYVVSNRSNDKKIRAIVPPKGLHVTYVVQEKPGQVHAVTALEKHCGSEPLLFLNASDYYTEGVIADAVGHIQHAPQQTMIAAVKTTTYFPGGYLKLDEQGTVSEIIEKPKQGKEPSDVVRILLDYIPGGAAFIAAAKKSQSNEASGYEDAVNMLIEKHPAALLLVGKDGWQPIKYPWHILDVAVIMLSTIKKQQIDTSVVIKEQVTIEGPVIIEEGVKIFEGTKIVGPCYIGKNTIIGNNNIIRSSVIGSDCVTGFNTDITRSVIGSSCWFHSNYIGDSVLDSDISLGSGTVLANLRLDDGKITSIVKDEKIETGRNKLGAMIASHVRIGVNTSTMPGVKIGSGSFIGAGVVLTKDCEEGQFCAATVSYTTKKNTATPAASREAFRKGL